MINMGEIKLVGYLMVAVLFLSIILMPLVEMFFVFQEQLLLGDALYNSCRAAAGGGYTGAGNAETGFNYANMRNVDAVLREEAFIEAFAETFAVSFGLEYVERDEYLLKFEPLASNIANNHFTVDLKFELKKSADYTAQDDYTEITATATSPYRFKIGYMQFINKNADINYELKSKREFTMKVMN